MRRRHEIRTRRGVVRSLSRKLLALSILFVSGAARATPLPGEPISPSTGPRALAAAAPVVTYGGGPVVSHPKVVSVFWGPNVISTVTTQVGGFYSSFVASNDVDWLCEYATPTEPIGRGSFAGNFTITPSTSATNLADATIGDEIASQINSLQLPAPTADTIYVLQFPPGVIITEPGGTKSCMAGGFCAYHGAWTRTVTGAAATIIYTVMPNFGPGGCPCGDKSVFDNFTKTSSHEIVEAMTDPIPGSGWVPEIGDPCSFSAIGDAAYASFVGSDGKTYQAQTEWSRRANACVGGGPCISAVAPALTVAHAVVLAAALCLFGLGTRPFRRQHESERVPLR